MLLWAEFSIQFLIPIIFLVIWAINQVFGRTEAPPPPVRDRIGPRPVPPPGQQRNGPSRAPQSASRAPSRAGAGSQGQGGGTPRPGPQQGRTAGRGRAGNRSAGPQMTEEVEPAQRKIGDTNRVPRPVPADIQEVYAIYDDHRSASKDVRSMTDLSGQGESDRLRLSHTSDTYDGTTGISRWADMVQGGVDPTLLREAILMSEILAPPLGAQRLRTIRSPGPPQPMAAPGPAEEPGPGTSPIES